jgi:hypothetical protein
MSDTYPEMLVDVLEYLNERASQERDASAGADSWLTNEEVSRFAYEDAVESLEDLLEEMLSRHQASDNDRETFAAYKARHGEN